MLDSRRVLVGTPGTKGAGIRLQNSLETRCCAVLIYYFGLTGCGKNKQDGPAPHVGTQWKSVWAIKKNILRYFVWTNTHVKRNYLIKLKCAKGANSVCVWGGGVQYHCQGDVSSITVVAAGCGFQGDAGPTAGRVFIRVFAHDNVLQFEGAAVEAQLLRHPTVLLVGSRPPCESVIANNFISFHTYVILYNADVVEHTWELKLPIFFLWGVQTVSIPCRTC